MPLDPKDVRKVEGLLEEAAKEGRQAGERASLRRVMLSAARRLLRADYEAAASIVEGSGVAGALGRLAETFLPGVVARWRERMRPVLSDVAFAATEPKEGILGVSFDEGNATMAEFLDGYVSELANTVGETTYRHVMEAIHEALREGRSVENTARAIRERSSVESPKRARLIARNELQRITKGASWVQALESGVVSGKRRNEQMDSKTRPEHRLLHGEERAIGEPYSNGELWAGETEINCRGWDEFLLDFGALGARGEREGEGRASLQEETVGGVGAGGGSGAGAGGGSGGGGGEDPLGPDEPGGPNHEWFRRATMADAKFDNFLFDPDHPQNRGKAQGLRRVLGLGRGDGELFKRLIREQLDQARIVERDRRVIGTADVLRQWQLLIPRFRGPNGNVAPLVTAWALDPANERPHFVTAYLVGTGRVQ